jgi:hypothetical protein
MASVTMNAPNELASPGRTGLFTSSNRQGFALAVLLAIIAGAVYLPVLHDPFVNFDDDLYVINNTHVNHGLSLDTVKWAFTTYDAFNWHPLTWLSHALDCQIFHLNPGGAHATNVLLHALCVALLFWVLWQATGYAGRSFVVAALFAVHPLNVESVAWISERKTMLSMLFFLLALGVYRWYAREPRITRYLMVAFLFALGLMAKPQVITFPMVLLLWDYWPLRRMFPSIREADLGTATQSVIPPRGVVWLVLEKAPLCVLCAASALVTMKAQRIGRPQHWPYTVFVRAENAIVSYARYVGKLFWPTRLGIIYPHPGNSLKTWQLVAASAFLLAVTTWVAVSWRHRYLTVGWLWFLGTMVPMVGLVQVGRQAMADRYAYLPFIGLFILLCWSAAALAREKHLPALLLPAISVAALVAFSAVTYRQEGYWKDNPALWSHTLQATSDTNWVAEFHLADALKKKGLTMQAMEHYYKALALDPSDPDMNIQVAFFEHQSGNRLQAIERYKMVIAKSDDKSVKLQAMTNLAYAYQELGDTENARQSFAAVVRFTSKAKLQGGTGK